MSKYLAFIDINAQFARLPIVNRLKVINQRAHNSVPEVRERGCPSQDSPLSSFSERLSTHLGRIRRNHHRAVLTATLKLATPPCNTRLTAVPLSQAAYKSDRFWSTDCQPMHNDILCQPVIRSRWVREQCYL